jgi:hypothetical protein
LQLRDHGCGFEDDIEVPQISAISDTTVGVPVVTQGQLEKLNYFSYFHLLWNVVDWNIGHRNSSRGWFWNWIQTLKMRFSIANITLNGEGKNRTQYEIS